MLYPHKSEKPTPFKGGSMSREGLITKDKVDGLSYRMLLIEKGKEILSHIKEIKERLK